MELKQSENSNNKTWFWILAGPNGAGKSTWAVSEDCINLLGNIPILNPDNFAEPYSSQPISLIKAGKKILSKISERIVARKSFAIETTLSGTHYLRLAKQLKNEGWFIGSVYIGVGGEDICVTRVEERKSSGGHDVPLKDILRRYSRSLKHIPSLLELSDSMIVLDNTENYRLILEANEGKQSLAREIPEWLSIVIECPA